MTATGPFYSNQDKHAPDLGDTETPCRINDPELWFSESNSRALTEDQRTAIALCNTCPVKAACLVQAQLNDEQFGIWGGLTPLQRGADPKRRKVAA